MSQVSEVIRGWLGWCPNAPALHTAPPVLMALPETMHAGQSDGSGPAGRSGRVREGVSIATGSLKTTVRSRYLLGFSFLAGLMMFLLIVAKVWDVQNWKNTLPFHIAVPVGNAFLVLDPWLFLVEMICLFCFTILLAGLILHRDANREKAPVTFREGFSGARTHAGPLAILSIELALIATAVFQIVYQSDFLTEFIAGPIVTAFFWIPFEYVPYGDVSALYISIIILLINLCLFLIALCLVPVIVLKKRLIPALAGSATLIQKTWHEILGCILVYGTIVLFVAAVALVIGHLPEMLYQGYDATDRGHPLMMVLYYGFILACFILMSAGFTAAGVAITDLCRVKKSDGGSGIPEGNREKPEPAS
jgi:hypothetical protein